MASDAAAYVMFTSGSSGRPKGVIIPHRGVVHLVKGQKYADFGPQLRTLFMASTAFDASTFELWGPLLNGGSTVVMVPDLPDLRLLEHQLTEHRVNCLWLTASLFNQIVETRPSLLSHAGHVLTGGEALSEGHVRRALSVAQPPRLTNGYGPTECTTFACTHELQRDEAYVDGRVPIGTPISQTRVSLRHADGQPAAPGEIGELWIGGPKVALGYIQAPELSDSRFVCGPDPAAPDGPPERWYRTGDRCRLRPDGLLEFHGRIDSQVKIRGFRVEPTEVECRLREHESVADAAVVAVRGEQGQTALKAWVTPKSPLRVPKAAWHLELRQYLKVHLPDAWLPHFWEFLDNLPLNSNGKVDRQTLAALGHPFSNQTHRPDAASDEPTHSKLEDRLLHLCRRLLHNQDFTPTADLTAFGANSLWRVSLTMELRREWGIEAPLDGFLRSHSVRDWALWLETYVREQAIPNGTDEPCLFFVEWGGSTPTTTSQTWLRGLPVKYGHDADHLVTISEVATGCADDISSKQPKGPYFLAGYSWGALVALETARILQDRGLEVRWIGLVDQEPPLALPRAIDSCLSFICSRLSLAPVNYNWLLNKVIGTTLIAKEARLRGPVVLWERLQQRRRNYKAAPTAIGSSGPGTVRHGPNRRPSSDFDLVHAWRQRTFMIHAAPPTQADACLFLTDNLSRNFPAILQRWSRYARITQEMRLPGSHNSLWKDRSALESALAHALAVHPEFRDRLGNGSHQQGSHSENTRHCSLP